MQIRKKIKQILTDNWMPKLVCLLAAVLVWLLVDHMVSRDEGPAWNMDDVLLTKPGN